MSEAVGRKKYPDGSQSFQFVGGPYNKMVFRIYPDDEVVRFPRSGDFAACTYELHEPIRKGGKWVYALRKETDGTDN
jgi:hypothetical protein